MWISATERVRDALIEMDPTSAGTYRTNAADYLNQLAGVDDTLEQAAKPAR